MPVDAGIVPGFAPRVSTLVLTHWCGKGCAADRVGRHEYRQAEVATMKFCLVDRITDLNPGESISTIKNVSLAEEYLQDHFPGFSVLPGVLMVEAMVQSCAWLSRVTDDFQFSTILLKQARAVKFNSFLKPGQTLSVTAKLRKNEDDTASFQAAGTVGDESAVSARIVLSKQNLNRTNTEMDSADERIQQSMRELFGQIAPESYLNAVG